MIEHGILENPKVDAALAYHVSPGKMPVGLFMYNDKGTMMYSVDGFKITVKGKGSHGAILMRVWIRLISEYTFILHCRS